MEKFVHMSEKENRGQPVLHGQVQKSLVTNSPDALNVLNAMTPPRQQGSGKRGALAPIENSPGVRNSSPINKKRRRGSSMSKRVSFGGEQIKLYNRMDEGWGAKPQPDLDQLKPTAKSPQKESSSAPEVEDMEPEAKGFDDVADDTVTMPDLEKLIAEDEKERRETTPSTRGSAEKLKKTKIPVFMDDDVTHGVTRSRLSEVFEGEDTVTVVLGGLSRQNSDLSEGDITRNIPSLADLVAGEQAEQKDTTQGTGQISDESDSFDRMYGKVFGDEATEDDLTNFTAATNVTTTHNITANIPSLGELLSEEKKRNSTGPAGDDDENVTREIPSFSALIEEDAKPAPEQKENEGTKENLNSDDEEDADIELPESSKSKLEEKLKRLSEPVTLGPWSTSLIASMESEARKDKDQQHEDNTTHEITAELADDIFRSGQKKGTSAPTDENQSNDKATDETLEVEYSIKDFLHNANLRFLDDMVSRRPRESSLGAERPEQSSPDGESTYFEKLQSGCCDKILLRAVESGSLELEKATVSTQDRAASLSRSIETQRPFVFAKMDGIENLPKEEVSDAQLSLKRLKNFCRLLARKQWYEWRAEFQSKSAEKLLRQKNLLATELSVLHNTVQTLERTSAAADADATLWNLRDLPSSRGEACPAELVDAAKEAHSSRLALDARLKEVESSRAAIARVVDLQRAQAAALTETKNSLLDFADSIEHSEKALAQTAHRKDVLSGVTGVVVKESSEGQISFELCSTLTVSVSVEKGAVISAKVVPIEDSNANLAAMARALEGVFSDGNSMESFSTLRQAASFLGRSLRMKDVATRKGDKIQIRTEDGAILIEADFTYSRLQTRKRFVIRLRQRVDTFGQSLRAIAVVNKIGKSPPEEQINQFLSNQTEQSLTTCVNAIAKAFL
ncbi:hypothetical protein NDN08_000393 [Rhodosorus marinus]|uniref:Spc7 kinetochore protein domain-containing protein n=1 Tax=Rhodosorus marinus TaxID=101924 RepID=A0AAV8UMR4_9RHOD|nr:hypothetical protein NDN08_000393 [Rhodosorus marinus]